MLTRTAAAAIIDLFIADIVAPLSKRPAPMRQDRSRVCFIPPHWQPAADWVRPRQPPASSTATSAAVRHRAKLAERRSRVETDQRKEHVGAKLMSLLVDFGFNVGLEGFSRGFFGFNWDWNLAQSQLKPKIRRRQ